MRVFEVEGLGSRVHGLGFWGVSCVSRVEGVGAWGSQALPDFQNSGPICERVRG